MCMTPLALHLGSPLLRGANSSNVHELLLREIVQSSCNIYTASHSLSHTHTHTHTHILYNNINFPDRATALASKLHAALVTMEGWLASTLRVVAVVVVARLSDARGSCGSARTMRALREVLLALRNNYYISRAPQILYI